MKPGTVLSVDDSEDDQLLLRRAWKKTAPPLDLQITCDGEKALQYLGGLENYGDRELFPIPDLILLDLKMPRQNGLEVLDWMKRELPAEAPPVAVFTSSQDAADIRRAYELGARWYLTKPVEYAELMECVRLIGRWFKGPRENDLSGSHQYRAPQPR